MRCLCTGLRYMNGEMSRNVRNVRNVRNASIVRKSAKKLLPYLTASQRHNIREETQEIHLIISYDRIIEK